MKKKKIQKQNIGNAGEYYIASILSAHNFTATITLGRAEKYDILAVNPNHKTLKISVKTRFLSNVKRFQLSEKNETDGLDDFYYAFVRLNEFKLEPDFWIIPSKRVNELLYNSHRKWLNIDSKYKDNPMRNLWIEKDKMSKELYPKNWEEELKKYYKNIEQLE
ncbi:MAG: hypothetical protein ACKKMV_03050 [Candidatus Nealsonbacteria bacterium]